LDTDVEQLVGQVVRSEPTIRERRLRIAMITSLRPKCGIADYSRLLLDHLGQLVEMAWVAPPDGFSAVMNEADVIHIQHQYFLFGGVAPWKNWFGKVADQITAPVVMTVHEFAEPSGNLAQRLAIAATNQAQFRHSAIKAFVVHTEADRQCLIALGVEPDRVQVMPHPVPPRPVLPPRPEAKRRFGLEDAFVLTIFGFLARRKGHLLAIEALRQLPPVFHLLFAGGVHPDDRTNYERDLRAAIQSAQLGDRVRITGYLEPVDVATAMSATDVVLAPFSAGSGSGSLSLAFACGKAVVATAIPANVEIQRRVPGTLLLVPPNDPRELRDAVLRLFRDRRALTRLAEGSVRYAAQYTYARMAEDTVRLYRAVAATQTL